MKTELHPLKFTPILKEKIWGGEKLKTQLKKDIPSAHTGESWEISDVEGDTSEVSTGPLKGKSLRYLLETYREELVGEKIYAHFGNKFPLLIKFIDAKENLSVQLHPDDTLAKKRHNSFGKTEMWHIVQADQNAGIIVGFKEGITKQDYLDHLEKESLQEILNFEEVKPGDTFFIKPGLIHAIGEGVVLAEIQQTSDITYRVYDWDRKDAHGKGRELHTELAIDAIDFEANDQFKVPYKAQQNEVTSLVKNKYFTTQVLPLSGEKKLVYKEHDSFVIFMCLEGKAVFDTGDHQVELELGETLLLPACFKQVIITGHARLLHVSV